MSNSPAILALEDGRVFFGTSFGAQGTTYGEVCFNTSMTGYQEILTDPSYCGQIVTMTYPQIGNYGVNDEDVESRRPALSGFIVREPSRVASNYRAVTTLDQYLAQHNLIGLQGIDTRALVRHIREKGALTGVLSTELSGDREADAERFVALAASSPKLVGRDLVREVVIDQPFEWHESLNDWTDWRQATADLHIVALDYGMKWNIARHLRQLGSRVTVLPGTATAEEVLQLQPDGVFLSNGPGDPSALGYAIEAIGNLLGKVPIFGICLGHQLLALACGAQTFKLKFGHRGANQPVIQCATERVEITAQNHGFAVEESTLPQCLEITHRNLNDDTIAGIRHREHEAFGVQYHPEASSGPHDSHYLFRDFQQAMSQREPA